MKIRYKIPIIALIGFSAFWILTPTIALHVCSSLDLDWHDTLFCNVHGQMIGEFVWDRNLWNNPVIQILTQIFSGPSCSNAEFNSSLPPCTDLRDASVIPFLDTTKCLEPVK